MGTPVIKTKKQKEAETATREAQGKAGPAVSDEQSSSSADTKPVEAGRIRLSCDITRDKHRQIKVYAAQKGVTILEVVENLIERHCTI